MAKRFLKEYARFITVPGFDSFNGEVMHIVSMCERGFISNDEAMRLLVHEKEFLHGKTDEQYRIERGI